MISNIAKAYVPKVLELAPIDFDYMLLSCEVGKKKTASNTDIYYDAHMRANNKRREIVMIGDHATNDYDAADLYGFYPIHMDWKQKNSKPHRVHTLEELLDLFPDRAQ
jgi:FMN phosphatase YigB (HAD superfamily)